MAATRLIGHALLAATALAGTVLVPAAASAGPEVSTLSSLHLGVQEGRSGAVRSTVLTCYPSGGSHPNASEACATLARANGDFDSLSGTQANAMCPLVYRPVTLTATGTWKNRPVQFEKTYPNACVGTSETGEVFDF
jgi:hypothetical protein